MEKDELRALLREFYESPLTVLEIEDGETRIKMEKPARAAEEGSSGVGSPDFAAGAAAAAKVAATALGAVAPAAGHIAAVHKAVAAAGGDAAEAAIDETAAAAAAVLAGSSAAADARGTAAPAPAAPAADDLIQIKAPIVGIYYASATPDDAPYVEVGAHVAQGDVLCLIEAMKMINEIKSPVAGTVRHIACESGSAVGYDDLLMLVEADE